MSVCVFIDLLIYLFFLPFFLSFFFFLIFKPVHTGMKNQ